MPASPALADRIASLDFQQGEPLEVSNQGEVRRFQLEGLDLAIKQPKGGRMAWALRAATLRHEHRVYQRLAGLTGIPACHGLFDGDRLALDFIAGQPFRGAAVPSLGEDFFDALLALIRAMHARGVAHGDLKRKSNLLIDTQGQPVILDFGTATLRKPGWRPINNRLFDLIRQTDINAWIKLKYGGYDGVSPADQRLLRRTGVERMLSRWRRP
jgi:predicted Ser/Thr protein kinase